ncbi:MAG: SAM-dependent methyltransferase [Crocinitomicaceae bacterium]|jgi:SAM-dependent methyltransferase
MADKWIDTTAATNLLEAERQLLHASLPNLDGHYLLQYSAWDKKILDTTTLKFDFFVGHGDNGAAHVDFLQLPFRDNTIDCVLLHHVVEQSENPHQSLREAARIVVPNGYIVIVAFNPWSCLGLSRYIPFNNGPKTGHYISSNRISDWLNLLGFRVEQVEATHFLPAPIASLAPDLSKKVDSAARGLGFSFGGAYILIARKLVAGRTPIRQQWLPLSGRRIPVATSTARGMRATDR